MAVTRTCNIGHNTTITTNYHLCLDYLINTTDTSDFIVISGSTTNTFLSMISVGLGSAIDPGVSFGHYITVRLKKNTSGTHEIEIHLIKDGDLIASSGRLSGPFGSFNTYQYELTDAEVARFEHSYTGLSFNIIGFGLDTQSSTLAWLKFELPQIAPCQ